LPLTLIYLARSLEIPFIQMLSIFIKPLIMALILLPFFIGYQALNIMWNDIWILASSALMSLAIWAVAVFVLYRNEFNTILNILKSRFNAKK